MPLLFAPVTATVELKESESLLAGVEARVAEVEAQLALVQGLVQHHQSKEVSARDYEHPGVVCL